MITLLLRRHLANPAIVPFSLASATVLLFVENELSPLTMIFLAVIAWHIVPQRADAFEASLPIRGREVVMARALVALAFMVLPVVAWLMLWRARGHDGTMPALHLESVLLCTLVILAPSVLSRGFVDGGVLRSPVAAWIGLAAVLWLTWFLIPTLATLVVVVATAAAFVLLWTSTPDALQLTACRPERSEGPAFVNWKSRSFPSLRSRAGAFSSGRQLGLLRSALSGSVMNFWAIVIAMSALGSDSGLFYFWIAVLIVSATVRTRMRWLAALPLSHRARLLAIVVPSVVVITCCVAIGTVAGRSMSFFRHSLTRDGPLSVEGGYDNRTNLSIDHWRRAPVGTAPVITAPWGEHVVADTATVFGVTLYNPWTTSRASTPRFVEWQFQGATAEVYGRPLTIAQYGTDRRLRPASGGVRTWLVSAALLLTFGLGILFFSELGYSHRRRPGSRTMLAVQWGAVLLAVAFMAADSVYRVRGGDVVYALLRRGLIELGTRLPSNPLLAAMVAALPVAAAYALLERQFRRSEPARTSLSS